MVGLVVFIQLKNLCFKTQQRVTFIYLGVDPVMNIQ